jgi:hypothetical protein
MCLLPGCATTISIQPPAVPRAETFFRAWITTLNAEDAAALESYQGPLPRQQALRAASGGYDVLSTLASANALMALVRQRKDGARLQIEFVLSVDEPPLLATFAARPVPERTTPHQPGWQNLAGDEGTGCADGTPYVFFYRAANPNKLLVHFQGGGACWNDATCGLYPRSIYNRNVHDRDHPGIQGGIFDFSRDDNPLKDYSVLYMPYCTADVFIGDSTVRYSVNGFLGKPVALEVSHRGAANVRRGLAFLAEQKLSPEHVAVFGESAGAISSAIYAADIADRYPQARVTQIGDAAGSYRSSSIPAIVTNWNGVPALRQLPAYRNIDPASITHEKYYTMGSKYASRVRYSQINMTDDGLQQVFLNALQVKGTIPSLLAASFADIRQESPTFRTYTGSAKMHVVLSRPEFYSMSVDGVRLRDWVAALIGGSEVVNVGEELLKGPPQ